MLKMIRTITKFFTVLVMYDFRELNEPAVPILKNELIKSNDKLNFSF